MLNSSAFGLTSRPTGDRLVESQHGLGNGEIAVEQMRGTEMKKEELRANLAFIREAEGL